MVGFGAPLFELGKCISEGGPKCFSKQSVTLWNPLTFLLVVSFRFTSKSRLILV